MSTTVKAADLAITIVVAVLKTAGLGPEADRFLDAIEGAKNCINLIDDIKNETVSDPNKELIRSLFKAIKEEVRSIKADLKDQGLGKDEIEPTADALIETTRLTVKQLAQDDDALLDAARLPDSFFKILVHRAEPLPDWCDDTISTLYRRLLKRVSEEFVARAQNFDRFDEVALASLLRDFLSAKKQMNRIERGVQENQDTNLETNRVAKEHQATGLETNQLVKELVQRYPYSIPSRLIFGSRPDAVVGERFIERGQQERLNSLIDDPTQRRTVLVGMRGCGKTQLAAALAHTCEEAQWSLVAWLNAGSRAQLDGEFVELARKLKIDLSDEPDQEQIVGRCIDHLRSADASDRLIVLDNVVDIEDLRDRIPRGAGLRVVATTTSREYDWEENGWKGISVGVFSRKESINYLLTVTGSQDRDTADAIAERLGDLPLAIAQAAATAHNEQWTLASYARRLEFSCGEKVISRIRGHYYSYAVSVALWMATDSTLERLDDPLSDAARRQLGALCLLAESGVPTRWLDPAAVSALSGCHDAELDSAVERAHRALIALINASIIRQSADGNTVTLHRLHAQVLRESWNNNEHDEARAAAADLLGSVDISRYPSNDTKARRQEALDLVDQLRSIGTQEYSQVLFEYPQIIRSLSQAFSHASDLGLPYEALTLDVAVDSLEGLLGPDHPDTLASRNNLAGAYKSAGRLTEAIALYEQVLTDHIRVLDEDHPDTLASRNHLAGAYKSAGRLDEAIALYKHVIADCTRVLGDDHPNTLTSRNNLAGAYKSAGRLTKAIALYEQVLTDRTRILGEDHPDTLTSRNNLAGVYQEAGRLDEAIALYKHVIADCTRVLGDDHPNTLTSRNNLAGAYGSAGRLTEAIALYEQVLTDRTRVLGEGHPDTLASCNNLAGAYESAGRLTEAIALYEQVLPDRIRVLGEDHPDTLASRHNLAYAYQAAGRLTEAIALYEQVLPDSIRVLGEDHPHTLASRHNLAGAYASDGNLPEAIVRWQALCADCLHILGPDHPLTVTVRENLEAARRELAQQEDDSAAE